LKRSVGAFGGVDTIASRDYRARQQESLQVVVGLNSYFGSKAASGLCQTIIALMPPHETYIETHLGGGAIMQRKPAAASNIGIDLDAAALANFSCTYPVRLVNDCALRFLAQYEFSGQELVYSDPPYLRHTRSSRRRYRFDYTEADHIGLLERLKSLPCSVLVSGYPSALYDELLGDWNSVSLQAMSRGGVRTEKLWFNYTLERVHWASYAGKNFTDRQRIKRKALRWQNEYRALPPAERVAVLAAIMAVEAQPLLSGAVAP
jgi:DNA adenine methylase